MKGLLISTDFVKRNDETLTPVEINTNSGHHIQYMHPKFNAETFLDNYGEVSDHGSVNQFMIDNELTKITIIESQSRLKNFFASFCDYYNYEFNSIELDPNSYTVPEYDEDEDEFLIRITYDAYAIVDDLYARDNYEFQDLIKGEDFSSPVTFSDNLDLDTINSISPPIESGYPNYVVKPRTPQYDKNEYPRLYRIETEEQLSQLKSELTDNEFIQKYEVHLDSLDDMDGRVSFFRSFDIIYGDNLENLHIIDYRSYNSVSLYNEKLVFDSETVNDLNLLHPLYSTKFYPTWDIRELYSYHFDGDDYILDSNRSDLSAKELSIGDTVTALTFDERFYKTFDDHPNNEDILNTATEISSSVVGLSNRKDHAIFINVEATNSDYGNFTWSDGIGTPYLIQKEGYPEIYYSFLTIGNLESGDYVYTYDINSKEMIKLKVTNVYFTYETELKTFLMTLDPHPEFLVKLNENSDLYLLQHNSCSSFCFGQPCSDPSCNTCSAKDNLCPDCGGFASGLNCGLS